MSAFVGVVVPHAEVKGDKTLEHALWRLAARLLPSESGLRELARRVASDPTRASRALWFALAEGDGAWFAAHVEALARAHPGCLTDLMDACRCLANSRAVVARLQGMVR
ncbi:MAG: hypothetical protein AB1938_03610 [Myxococcota bacterium]